MEKLVFATHNKDKLREVRLLLNEHYDLLSLDDLNVHEEIPETADTIQGNAHQKAHHIYGRFQINCFADDTGLEIDALGGDPGVYSARYAGENCSYQDNVSKVLLNMLNIQNRKACFKTVICLIQNGVPKYFEGKVNGNITTEQKGDGGFGYDPIFLPEGFDKTFAEIDPDEKNRISHRGIAVKKLITYLAN